MLIQQIRYLPITTLHYIHVKIISKKSNTAICICIMTCNTDLMI